MADISTTKARALLEAAEHEEDCGSRPSWEECCAAAEAEETISCLGFTPKNLRLVCDAAEALREEHTRAVAWETQNGSSVEHQKAIRRGRYDRWAKDCPACQALAAWDEMWNE